MFHSLCSDTLSLLTFILLLKETEEHEKVFTNFFKSKIESESQLGVIKLSFNSS